MRIKSILEHPGFIFMRVISRFKWVRQTAVGLKRLADRCVYHDFIAQTDSDKSIFKSLDIDEIVTKLQCDGFALGINLPLDLVQSITAFSANATFYADKDPSLGFKPSDAKKARTILGRDFLLAQCFNAGDQCAFIRRLETDPKLLLIAAKYLSAYPTHVGTNMWWSYAVRGDEASMNKAAQMFHYDLDDYAFVKFFFYLTDVDEQSGPHVCVRGSHRKKNFSNFKDRLLIRRYTDSEIADLYGADNIKTICGEAGQGFAEDTLCIHKGETPVARDRLLLQIQYALYDHGVQRDEVPVSLLKMIATA